MRRTTARRGATYLDVLVVIVLMTGLASALTSVACRSHETAVRVKCAANLQTIGQAFLLYASENRYQLPKARYDPESADRPVAYTRPLVKNPFAEDGPGPNDVTAALFLLLRTQEITPEVFTCPSSNAERWNYTDSLDTITQNPTAHDRSNFPSEDFLSYGLTNPYVKQEVAGKGFKWSTDMNMDFAVAADIGAKSDAVVKLRAGAPYNRMASGNSPNHDGDGQNVLYGDGHVEFQMNAFVGFNGDNIYTVGVSKPSNESSLVRVGSPANEQDSVILPVSRYDVGSMSSRLNTWQEGFENKTVLVGMASAVFFVAFVIYARTAVRS